MDLTALNKQRLESIEEVKQGQSSLNLALVGNSPRTRIKLSFAVHGNQTSTGSQILQRCMTPPCDSGRQGAEVNSSDDHAETKNLADYLLSSTNKVNEFDATQKDGEVKIERKADGEDRPSSRRQIYTSENQRKKPDDYTSIGDK